MPRDALSARAFAWALRTRSVQGFLLLPRSRAVPALLPRLAVCALPGAARLVPRDALSARAFAWALRTRSVQGFLLLPRSRATSAG